MSPQIDAIVTSDSRETRTEFNLAIHPNSSLFYGAIASPIFNQIRLISGQEEVSFNTTIERNSFPSSLGIGPGSPLLGIYNSIGVFASEIVLNISESEFTSRCVSESVLTIPLFQNENRFYTHGTVFLGPRTPDSSKVPTFMEVATRHTSPLLLPPNILEQVVDHLENSGSLVRFSSQPYLIYSTQDAIQSLPDFIIDFGPAGQMTIRAWDFAQPVFDTDLYLLQIHIAFDVSNTWALSPIALPGVNVYLTNEMTMRICDDATVPTS
jgi:hypothetical protein